MKEGNSFETDMVGTGRCKAFEQVKETDPSDYRE
jgi:hypothetical protein